MSEVICLIQYSYGVGCGCKILFKVLEVIFVGSGVQNFDLKFWVGNVLCDDVVVYVFDEECGVVFIIDFFMLIVDDFFDFGCIVVINVISDIYVMGGDLLMVIVIFGWLVNVLVVEVVCEVIVGGCKVCEEVGILLVGGYFIDVFELIFGLVVIGVVEKCFMKCNDIVEVGCRLYLIKLLGIGIFIIVEKKVRLCVEDVGVVCDWMCILNRFGVCFGWLVGVKVMIDVIGFGLFGYLVEMVDGSKFIVCVEYVVVLCLVSVEYYLEQGCVFGGILCNFDSYGECIVLLLEVQKLLFCDLQISGGLLVVVVLEGEVEFFVVVVEFGL